MGIALLCYMSAVSDAHQCLILKLIHKSSKKEKIKSSVISGLF